MATTTNNGWETPDDTDLVKDGALAMRTLGNAIDTSVGTGLLAWTSWTPVITSGGGTLTSTSITTARYVKLGKIAAVQFDITITNNGTGAGSILMTLPSGAGAKNANQAGAGREVNVNGKMLQVYLSGTGEIRILNYDNTYPAATNYRLIGSLTYELA